MMYCNPIDDRGPRRAEGELPWPASFPTPQFLKGGYVAYFLVLSPLHQQYACSSELQKLGPLARGTMYIKLSNFPSHYLVLVITEEDFRYALISVKVLPDSQYGDMIMEDIGWLGVQRIRGGKGPSEVVIGPRVEDPQVGQKRKRDVASSAHNTLRREDK